MYQKELRMLQLVMNALRVVDDAMPVQTFSVFLEVARRDGIGVSEVAGKVGVSQSSASRNVAALSDRHWLKRPGLGLVTLEMNPEDIRRKIVALTPKGIKLVKQLSHIVSAEGRAS